MRFIIILLLVFHTIISYSQVNMDYHYYECKPEFEFYIAYNTDNMNLGITYSEDRYLFNRNNDYYMYLFVDYRLKDNVYLHFAESNKFKEDIEISLDYEYVKNNNILSISLGLSKMDFIMIDIKYILLFK